MPHSMSLIIAWTGMPSSTWKNAFTKTEKEKTQCMLWGCRVGNVQSARTVHLVAQPRFSAHRTQQCSLWNLRLSVLGQCVFNPSSVHFRQVLFLLVQVGHQLLFGRFLDRHWDRQAVGQALILVQTGREIKIHLAISSDSFCLRLTFESDDFCLFPWVWKPCSPLCLRLLKSYLSGSLRDDGKALWGHIAKHAHAACQHEEHWGHPSSSSRDSHFVFKVAALIMLSFITHSADTLGDTHLYKVLCDLVCSQARRASSILNSHCPF